MTLDTGALFSLFAVIIVVLAVLLIAAYRYCQHREEWFDTWVRIRIRSEMGVTWYERFKDLDLDHLWMQFTYDVSGLTVSKGTRA